MKNRVVIAVVLGVLVGGVTLLSTHSAPVLRPLLAHLSTCPCNPCDCGDNCQCALERQVTGTGQMTESPAAYTIVALPKDYKTNNLSQEVIQQFATSDTLHNLRAKTEVLTMVEGNPLLQSGGPLSGIKWFPTVAVIDGDQLLFKRSGGYCTNLEADLDNENVLEQLGCRPHPRASIHNPFKRDNPESPCPRCEPNRPLNPRHPVKVVVDKPEEPELPDTPGTPGKSAPVESDSVMLFAVIAGALAACISYFHRS